MFAMIIMALVCMGFVSCGGDEDDEINSGEIKTDSKNPNAIDLGLSVLWADRNVGALFPEHSGTGISWGETAGKNNFYYNYVFQGTKAADAPRDISGTDYDAAKANWGGRWRMPTKAEVEELIQKCQITYERTSYNDGLKVVGKNGNFIFLPENYIGKSNGPQKANSYWTSNSLTTTQEGAISAVTFVFPVSFSNYLGEKATINLNYKAGFYPLVIRPVMSK